MIEINFDKEIFKTTCQRYNLSLVILHGSYVKGIAQKICDNVTRGG